MIIDCEFHAMPMGVFTNPDAQFRGSFWGEMTAAGIDANRKQAILFEPDKLLAVMDEAGVDLAVVTSTAGWHATHEACCWLNDWQAELMVKYPGRFAGLGHINPLAGERALREIERATTILGLKGIGIPYFLAGDVQLDSPLLTEFYAELEAREIPLFIHPSIIHSRYSMAPEPLYHPTLVREYDVTTAVARLIYGGVLRAHPGLKVVVSHFGGLIMMAKERMVGGFRRHGVEHDFDQDFSRLYFNMAGYEGNMSIVKFALQKVSPDHLLFGTDFPYNFQEGAQTIKQYIADLRGLDLEPEQVDRMLGGNAQALFKLS